LVAYDSVVVTWITNELSSSRVDWGSSISYSGTPVTSSTTTIEHAVTLTGLEQATTYYFRVKSTDASGNLTTDDNTGNGYTFTTDTPTTVNVGSTVVRDNRDLNPPDIGTIAVVNITDSSAELVFETSEHASALIDYGKTNDYGTKGGYTDEFKKQHDIILSGLLPDTEYHFRVTSADIYEMTSTGRDQNFRTLPKGVKGVVTDVNSLLGGTGTTTATSTSTPSVTSTQPADKLSLEETSVIASAERIASKASNLFISKMTELFFSSGIGEEQVIASVSEAASKIVSPPVISGVSVVVEAGPRSAVIRWVTDKESSSIVAYASAKEYNLGAENPYTINAGFPDDETTEHTVTLSNLEPDTTYHYKGHALNADEV
ncbi:MAG: fibronectin type III domain-containing protein, partial [bacterium]